MLSKCLKTLQVETTNRAAFLGSVRFSAHTMHQRNIENKTKKSAVSVKLRTDFADVQRACSFSNRGTGCLTATVILELDTFRTPWVLFHFCSFLHPCLTSSKSSPKEMIAPLSPLCCQNGDTVDAFCFCFVTTVFKLSRKHTDAGNFKVNHKATKETELGASMGYQTDSQEVR